MTRAEFIAAALRAGVVSTRCDDHAMHLAELRDDPIDPRGDYDMLAAANGSILVLPRRAPGALTAAIKRYRWGK